MKKYAGWLALLVFVATCVFIGQMKYFSRSLNFALLIMLVSSTIIVYLLYSKRFK